MRLREYKNPNEIPQYSCAITPGRHCPLFGVSAALRSVEGITLIYIGTQDCVYYAQKEVLTRQAAESKADSAHSRTLAVQLSDSDLIFGIRPQLKKLLEAEAFRETTKAIYLVTSCSVEVLSEDLDSVVRLVSRQSGKKVCLIPTENFKTFSYYQGIEDALTALTSEITPQPKVPKSFAVLGARHPGSEQCEPVRYLLSQGYTLQSILPFDTDLARIERLAQVGFTILLEGSGFGVAQMLQQRFRIPCIRFDKLLDLDSITAAWTALSSLSGKDMAPYIQEQRDEIQALSRQASALVSGKTFFYGQKVLYPFETCLFLADLGMIPTCIFLGSSIDKSDEALQALSARYDPVICRNASIAAIREMLDNHKPDYIFGIVGGIVPQYRIRAMSFELKPVQTGFEYYKKCLKQILTLAQKEEPQ